MVALEAFSPSPSGFLWDESLCYKIKLNFKSKWFAIGTCSSLTTIGALEGVLAVWPDKLCILYSGGGSRGGDQWQRVVAVFQVRNDVGGPTQWHSS